MTPKKKTVTKKKQKAKPRTYWAVEYYAGGLETIFYASNFWSRKRAREVANDSKKQPGVKLARVVKVQVIS